MQRTGRKNGICFKSLEKTLEKSPETYRHIDLVAFGFPCQDISGANPKGKGLAGEKSSIFYECIRITRLFNPSWILIENVPRLLSINNGRDFGIVLQTLSESGYGYSWRILDSQYFGVAQRRKRLFIVGCFGRECPPEVLFEPQSHIWNDKKKRKIRQRVLCLSTRTGERQDPTAETFIANVVQANDYRKTHVWQDTHIAEINPDGKRKASGIPKGLDSHRGIVIGNAVTVNVAEWIGKRILKYGGLRLALTKGD